MSIGPYILLLPDIALEKIFSFLPFDEIARNREVCSKFNDIGSNVLSRGFVQIERRHASVFKRVKSLLPRRESERRLHPLFRHCDILSAVETRISMLNITYMKYIQNGLCCFIPGKVLDELVKVLNVVEQAGSPPRANEILQELRDISSMAIEYFDEKISPRMRGQQSSQSSQFRYAFLASSYSPNVTVSKAPKVYFVQPAMQEEIRKLTKVNNRQRAHMNCLNKEVQRLYLRVQKQQNKIKAQAALIQENTTKIQEQENKALHQDATIAELKKHVGEWERKLTALTTEVVNSRDEIVRAIFPMPAEMNQNQPPPAAQQQQQQHKTTIRPRVSQVQTPNTYIVELERKRKASMDTDIPNKLRFIMAHEPNAYTLKEQATNKINETITQNIAQNIRDEVADTSRKKFNFNGLLSSSMDALIRNSIGIKAPKRRYTADADVLVNLH